MITINLVPRARRRRESQQLTHEDRTLIFVVIAVLIALAGSYVYARFLVTKAQTHLADLQGQISVLGEEQKLLDLNRSLAQRSLSMETNLVTAIQSQANINQVLDDLGKDVPKNCVLTEVDATLQGGQLKITAGSTQFINLVRLFNALSGDRKFASVRINTYQVPYSTGTGSVGGTATQATMNLSLTWVGGGKNG